VETIEHRVPRAILAQADATAVRRRVATLAQALAEAGLATQPLFLEADGEPGADDATIRALSEWRGSNVSRAAGFKLRCGGARPEDIPAAPRVAHAVQSCAGRGVPMKLTAGLHHPVRRFVDPPGVMQHGFLNVFGAGILAASGGLSGATTVDCLLDEDPTHFRFENGRFSWKDHGVEAGEVAAARRSLMTSFGSCSFDEPRDDLRALGLLTE
jgi:hypothetical protein